MKHIRLLLVVAAVTLVSLSLISQTPVSESLWPWIIGLAGPIIRVGQLLFASPVAPLHKWKGHRK